MCHYWCVIIVFVVILRPHFAFLPDAISVYIFDAVLAAILTLIFVIDLFRVKTSGVFNVVLGFWILVLLALTISVCVQLTRGEGSGAGPLIAKWLLYGSFFLSLLHLDRAYPSVFRGQLKTQLLLSIWLLLGIALIQAAAVPGAFAGVVQLYGDVKLKPFNDGYGRVYSSFYNANWFGIYSASVFLLLIGQSVRRRVFYLLALIVCVALSGSRSAMAMMVFGLLAMNFRIVIVAVVALAALILAYVRLDDLDLPKRLLEVRLIFDSGDLDDVPSLAGRVDTWQDASSAIALNPFTGSGDVDLVSHNAYLSLMSKVGIPVGVAAAVFIFYGFFALCGTKRVFPLLFAFAAVLLTGDFLESTQLVLALSIAILSLCGPNENPLVADDARISKRLKFARSDLF